MLLMLLLLRAITLFRCYTLMILLPRSLLPRYAVDAAAAMPLLRLLLMPLLAIDYAC